jgi:hypothetical protein
MYTSIEEVDEYKLVKRLANFQIHHAIASAFYFIIFTSFSFFMSLHQLADIIFAVILFLQCVIIINIRIQTHFRFREDMTDIVKHWIKKIVVLNILLWVVMFWMSIFLLQYINYTDDLKIICGFVFIPNTYYLLVLVFAMF